MFNSCIRFIPCESSHIWKDYKDINLPNICSTFPIEHEGALKLGKLINKLSCGDFQSLFLVRIQFAVFFAQLKTSPPDLYMQKAVKFDK